VSERDSAKLFLHKIIFSHLSYCSTSWCQAGGTKLKPLCTHTNKLWKFLTKKNKKNYHHCIIIKNSTY